MNKTLLISTGTIVVVGLIVLAFWLISPNSKTSTTNFPTGQNVLPIANPVGNPVVTAATTSVSGIGMIVAGASGESIQTSNFINDPATAKDPINSGYYYLGYHVNEGVPDATATDNPPYVIEYISATQYFNIALLQEPIGQVRKDAQQYLISHLGISQSQMCQLNYMVSVPWSVNQQFTGRNLGFSFCPGATHLPK